MGLGRVSPRAKDTIVLRGRVDDNNRTRPTQSMYRLWLLVSSCLGTPEGNILKHGGHCFYHALRIEK